MCFVHGRIGDPTTHKEYTDYNDYITATSDLEWCSASVLHAHMSSVNEVDDTGQSKSTGT